MWGISGVGTGDPEASRMRDRGASLIRRSPRSCDCHGPTTATVRRDPSRWISRVDQSAESADSALIKSASARAQPSRSRSPFSAVAWRASPETPLHVIIPKGTDRYTVSAASVNAGSGGP